MNTLNVFSMTTAGIPDLTCGQHNVTLCVINLDHIA